MNQEFAADISAVSSEYSPVYSAGDLIGYNPLGLNIQKYICKHCSAVYHSKTTLIRHCRRKHGLTGGYQCSVCNEVFGVKRDMERHQEVHKSDKFPDHDSHLSSGFF